MLGERAGDGEAEKEELQEEPQKPEAGSGMQGKNALLSQGVRAVPSSSLPKHLGSSLLSSLGRCSHALSVVPLLFLLSKQLSAILLPSLAHCIHALPIVSFLSKQLGSILAV